MPCQHSVEYNITLPFPSQWLIVCFQLKCKDIIKKPRKICLFSLLLSWTRHNSRQPVHLHILLADHVVYTFRRCYLPIFFLSFYLFIYFKKLILSLCFKKWHFEISTRSAVLIYIGEQAPKVSFKKPIGSVSVSGHKFVGCPMPCGVQITRLDHINALSRNVEYLASRDATIMGSRNGHAPIFLWYTLNRKGYRGFRKEVQKCLRNAHYLKDRLIAAGIGAMLNELSSTGCLWAPTRWGICSKVATCLPGQHCSRCGDAQRHYREAWCFLEWAGSETCYMVWRWRASTSLYCIRCRQRKLSLCIAQVRQF